MRAGRSWTSFVGRNTFAGAFLCLSIFLLWYAARATNLVVALLIVWVAFDFLLVAFAYLWRMPRIFGKTRQGTLLPFPAGLMLPFLLMVWIVWRLQYAVVSEPIWNEVVPGLYVGRRCRWHQLPPNTTSVIDCTAEFPADRVSRQALNWLCLPILDGCAPTWEDCRRAFDFVDCQPGSTLLIFCANGHGRSATLAALLLMKRRIAHTPDAAMETIKHCRPQAALNAEQRRFLEDASPKI